MTESLIVGYAPGVWRVVATAHGVVMVDAAVPPTAVAGLWTTLAEEVDLHRVLDALTVGTGGTLATLPPFAVVLRENGATRVAVRGALRASTTEGAGTVELSGEGVTTWNERLVVAGTVRVAAVDAAQASFDLAVRDGVVLADSIHVRWLASADLSVPTAPDAASGPADAEPPAETAPPAEAAAPPARPTVGQPWFPPAAADALPVTTVDAAPPTPAARPVVGQPWIAPATRDAARAQPGPTPAGPTPAGPATAEPTPAEPTGPEASAPAPAPAEPPVLVPPVAPWLVGPAPLVASSPHSDQRSDHARAVADTRVTVEDAVLREPEPAADVVVGRPGDHDGATISVAEARALRGDRSDTTPPPLAPPRSPAPGRARLSTGDVIPLDRTVVIGRRPRSTRITGTDLPRLVPVDSPLHDISRSHLELRVEGDVIVATDLQTTNGTLLLRRATAPTRLHPGEPTVVVPGDVLDLGDGVRVAIEELV